MAKIAGPVTGGVDTHAGTHVAAVVDQVCQMLGIESFPACAGGYAGLLAWLRGHGVLAPVGVEGTGSYGAGLARFLASQDVPVPEVPRPDRQRLHRRGKSDAVDAVSAAIAALSGEDCGTPKSGDGAAESIRALRVARIGAMKARTQAGNQLRDLIITAPQRLRAQLSHLSTLGGSAPPPLSPAAMPLTRPRAPKRLWRVSPAAGRTLGAEITGLEAVLEQLVARVTAPEYLALTGVGYLSVAALIAAGDNPGRSQDPHRGRVRRLCGVSTVDCSSGKQERRRLNHGGDRQANSALWRIAVTRLRHDPRTQDYYARRTAAGKDTQGNYPRAQALRRPRGLPQAHLARLHPSRRDPFREGRLKTR